jgi:hypothetical protein|tara:strand:- start:179 stop:541 length:363 start_codon:yes stop_codon:yes gene_type:complete
MWRLVITIILTSIFFVLFFEPYIKFNIDINSKNKASTVKGFIEDTRDAFIMPRYPTQVMDRDITGELEPVYGDIGTFAPYSSISEDHWLYGFPHESGEIEIPIETREQKLQRRSGEIMNT